MKKQPPAGRGNRNRDGPLHPAARPARRPKKPAAMLRSVEHVPGTPAEVDLAFVQRHCPALPELAGLSVQPLAGNGGGLTGASLSRLHCRYAAGAGVGPATLILKLSDVGAMQQFKEEREGGLAASSADRGWGWSMSAFRSRALQWAFALSEHDIMLNEALFYGSWRQLPAGQGCDTPRVWCALVSLPGLPACPLHHSTRSDPGASPTDDSHWLISGELLRRLLSPPQLELSQRLSQRRSPTFFPYVVRGASSGLRVALIMEDLLAAPETTRVYPQFGIPRVHVPASRLHAVMRAMARFHRQGWGALQEEMREGVAGRPTLTPSPWCSAMIFGLHPIFRPVKRAFGRASNFKTITEVALEWRAALAPRG